MGWVYATRGVVAAVLFLSVLARGAGYEEGGTYEVDIDDVRPTQFAVGFKEIQLKVRDIERAIAKGELKELKWKKRGLAVVGPNGLLYLVDGHHFARALLEAGKKSMLVKVKKDYSDLGWAEFWKKMRKKDYCYLVDENGVERDVADLPKSFKALKDDRYRALAWLVREADGYENLTEPFQEFRWAEFFRTRVRFTGSSYESWEKALLKAMELAASREAKNLPGYTGEPGDCKTMLALLWELEDIDD